MWQSQLASGVGRQQVAWAFWNSIEHRAEQVRGFYETYLGRSGAEGEVMGWAQHLHEGMSEAQVAVSFLTSAEFLAAHPQADDFVRSVYRLVLGREASDAEAADYGGRLVSMPSTLTKVATSEAASPYSCRPTSSPVHRSWASPNARPLASR